MLVVLGVAERLRGNGRKWREIDRQRKREREREGDPSLSLPLREDPFSMLRPTFWQGFKPPKNGEMPI